MRRFIKTRRIRRWSGRSLRTESIMKQHACLEQLHAAWLIRHRLIPNRFGVSPRAENVNVSEVGCSNFLFFKVFEDWELECIGWFLLPHSPISVSDG